MTKNNIILVFLAVFLVVFLFFLAYNQDNIEILKNRDIESKLPQIFLFSTDVQITNLNSYLTNTSSNGGNFTHLQISDQAPYDSLIAYWSFDADINDTTGTTAYDYSSNSIDGTYTGNTVSNETSGLYDNGITLDGNGDYIAASDVDTLNPQNITVMAWVKRDSAAGNGRYAILGKFDNVNAQRSYYLGSPVSSDVLLAFSVSDDGTDWERWDFGANMPGNVWGHVAATWNGSDVIGYLNGVNQNLTIGASSGDVVGALHNDDSEFRIGAVEAQSSTPNYLPGEIDEVMIFREVLTEAQIQAIFNNQSTRYKAQGTQTLISLNVSEGNSNVNITIAPTEFKRDFGTNISVRLGEFNATPDRNTFVGTGDPSLVLYMPFDLINGSNDPTDISQQSNNGSIVGNAHQNDSGYFGDGFEFDGDGDSVGIDGSGQVFNMSRSNAVTISAWIYSNQDQAQATIFSRGSNSGSGAGDVVYYLSTLNVDSTAWRFGVSNGSAFLQTSSTDTVQVGTWSHIAGVYNGTGVSLYIDGSLINTDTDANFGIIWDGDADNDRETAIGMNARYSSEYFNGSIDEVMIFNRTLSADEIKSLYTTGSLNHTNPTVGINWTFSSYKNLSTSNPRAMFNITNSVNQTRVLTDFLFLSEPNNFHTPILYDDITLELFGSGPGAPADEEYPYFYNYYDDNASHLDNGIAHFNVSVNLTNGTVFLEINGANYTAFNQTSNMYNTTVNISGGTYTYYWGSYGNGTSANYNVSAIRSYTVNQTSTPLTVSFSDPTPSDSSSQIANAIPINLTVTNGADYYSFLDFNNSLKLWMTFNTTNSSGDPIDLSGNGNDGSLLGAASLSQTGSKFGTALNVVTDNNDQVKIKASNSLNIANAITVSVWVNFSTVIDSQNFINKKNTNAGTYAMYTDADNKVTWQIRLDGSEATARTVQKSSAYVAGTWYHFVGTFNGSTMDLWMNGNHQNQLNVTGSIDTDSNGILAVGGHSTSSTADLRGLMDDVLIFDRALTQAEIKSLHDGSANKYYRNFTDLGNGTYVFKGGTADTLNQFNLTSQRSVTIGQDADPPSVTSLTESPADPLTFSEGQLYQFNATITDATAIDVVYIEFNGTNYTAHNMTANVYNYTFKNLSNGFYNYYWWANDTNGYVNNSESGNYNITSSGDTEPPYFTDIPSPSTITTAESFEVQFNATDSTAFDTYAINWTTIFSINSSGNLKNISGLSQGVYLINVTINDTSNNINSTIYSLTVNEKIPDSSRFLNWTKDSGNPLFEDVTGYVSWAVNFNGTYYHYIRNGSNGFQLMTSNNGLGNWTNHGNVLPRGAGGSWDDAGIITPNVWIENGIWYMLYGGWSGSGYYKMGLANSTNGINWTKHVGNPVAQNSTEHYEPAGLIKVNSTTYCVWHNNIASGSARHNNLACSTDLISWTENSNNPIFTGGRHTAGTFKYNGKFYLLQGRYTSGSDFSEFELYESTDHTFPSGSRTRRGIAYRYGYSGEWDDTETDGAAIVAKEGNASYEFNSSDIIRVYYGGEGGDSKRDLGVIVETRTMEELLDFDPPSVTSLTESPADPATFSEGQLYQFNATITDLRGIDKVFIEFDGVNYTAFNMTANVYNYTFKNLSIANYTYYWFTNDTYGFVNSSESGSYNVSQVAASDTEYPIFSSYYDNNASLLDSGTALFNVTITSTNGTVFLDINGTNYTATNLTSNVYNVSVSLTGGTYDYYWGSWGNGTDTNYNTSIIRSYTVNVSSDTTPPYFTTIPSDTVINYTQGFGVDFDATDTTAFDTYAINWTTLFSINSSGYLQNTTSLGVAVYQINVTINDTSNNINSTIYTVTVNKIDSVVNLTLNSTEGNITITDGDTILLNGTLITGDPSGTLRLYNNGTLINQGSTEVSNSTTFSGAGMYNITVMYVSSQNYSVSAETYWVNVTEGIDESPPSVTSLTESPTDPAEFSEGQLYQFNATITDSTAIDVVYLEFNGTNYTAHNMTANVYNVTIKNLSISNYTYYWFTNDTLGYVNNSESRTYNVTELVIIPSPAGGGGNIQQLLNEEIEDTSVNTAIAELDNFITFLSRKLIPSNPDLGKSIIIITSASLMILLFTGALKKIPLIGGNG